MTPTLDSRRWLVDKSALVRFETSPDWEEWANRINRGLVHITTMTLLEIGFSARSADEHRSLLQQPPVAAMPMENVTRRPSAVPSSSSRNSHPPGSIERLRWPTC
jgi:predicted nucleic acid-binding protein